MIKHKQSLFQKYSFGMQIQPEHGPPHKIHVDQSE